MRSLLPLRHTTTRLGPASADGERLLTFPICVQHAARDEQHRLRRLFPPGGKPSDQDRRAAVLVLPQWNSDAGGHVGLSQAARAERHDGAASQPALSRSADAARAPARRLHRERECRANGAGLPSGGARCPSRDCLACRRRVRTHRHPWIEPRVVSVAADDGA